MQSGLCWGRLVPLCSRREGQRGSGIARGGRIPVTAHAEEKGSAPAACGFSIFHYSDAIMSIRIIGGIRRGALLSTREGSSTRPLLARVRQSLFDMLGSWVSGSRALDLFAGSGAVGLEALSRGAAWATLVDRDAEAIRIIERNIGKLRFADRCRAVRGELPRAADTLPLPPDMKPYDLLFIMPPFGYELLGPTLEALAPRTDLFAPLTFVVGQLQTNERIPTPPPEFQKIEERVYGQTRLLFWKRASVSREK